MEYFILYLCSIASALSKAFAIIGVVGLIVAVILFFMSVCSSQCEHCSNKTCIAKGIKLLGIKTKSVVIPSVISIFLAVIIPSTSSCYAIFGIGATLQYINSNEEAKKIPDNAIKAINRYLESINNKPDKNEN